MIYFIKCGEFVKIGVTDNIQARLAGMRTNNPYPLEVLATIPGDYELELKLHYLCAKDRHAGEWFRFTERVSRIIQSTIHNHGGSNEDDLPGGDWRFEIKRKPRKASRKNAGSTAGKKWYYWVVRVGSDGRARYYGTLADIGMKP